MLASAAALALPAAPVRLSPRERSIMKSMLISAAIAVLALRDVL